MATIKLFIFLVIVSFQLNAQQKRHIVKNLKITILSTMLAQEGIGEWGFSALVEADSIRILFDAGGRERTVLSNVKELKTDLSNITDLILSHGHDDHTAGWLPLRKEMSALDPSALSVTHLAPGFFDTRILVNGTENSNRKKDSLLYIQTGGTIHAHDKFKEIYPGIYLTGGNVPRIHPEKNYPPRKKKDARGNIVDDIITEDMSMVIATGKGLVLLSGCGHAGLINTADFVRLNLPGQPLIAAIGGFHLLADTDQQLASTAVRLKDAGLQYFMGAHCTGIEPVYQIRMGAGLKKNECIVGSVGATFDLTNGFISGQLTMGPDRNAYFKK